MNKIIQIISLLFLLIATSCSKVDEQEKSANINGEIKEILVRTVTEKTFQEVVLAESEQIVAVDFWAEWCGPCRKLSPIIENVAKKYKGKIKFVKVNVDKNKSLAQKYQIRSIPNVKFFKNGLEIDEFVGLLPQKGIEKKVDSLLKNL